MAPEEKKTAGLPFISVIIPAHNPGKMLAECLEPFRRSAYPAFEVLVVDDASFSPIELPGYDPGRFRVARLNGNFGPAVARNEGAKTARGDILLFTDTDVVVSDDCLEKVGRFFQDEGREDRGLTGVQTARMRHENFSSQYKNLWLRYSFLKAPSESALFYTSIGAVPRALFLRLGGFDARYRTPSLEDTDFGNRLWEAGGRVRIDKNLEVCHNKRYTFRGLIKNDLLRSAEETRTWLRNFGKTESLFAGRTSVPGGFAAGIIFTALAVCGGVIFLMTGAALGLILLPAGLIGIWLSNLRMILWMKGAGGYGFLIRVLLFLPLNMLVAGLGILWGMSSYLGGRKH